jgi:hypothetical protein
VGKKKKKFGECPYCGKMANLTEDHIIPKCLFKPNTLERAFKTYVCSDCNNDEKSKDDSFLRDLLVTDKDSQGSSTARLIRSEKYESSVRQNKSELNRDYLLNATKQPILTEGGIYVYGQRFSVEKSRLIRIFKRIITGLSYSLLNLRINDRADVTVFKKVISQKEFDSDFEHIKNNLKNEFYTGNLGHTFHFRVQIVNVDGKLYSYWWLTFYDNVCYFLAICAPTENE